MSHSTLEAVSAARWRIARHLLTESVILSIAGGLLGLGMAYVGLKGAGALIPAQFRMLDLQAGVNVRVLVWCLGLALVSGVLVGILPALHATRTDPHDALKADGRAGAGRGTRRLRHALVVAEIALSVVLLLGAGLLLRSFLNVQRADPGFDPAGVLIGQGLEAGEQVVTAGVQALHPGQKVRVLGAAS